MDFQNLVLCEKFTERPINCYSPPHTYAYSSWTDTLPALSLHPTLTDTIQMHPIRFPTPPITPPKEWALPSRSLRAVANTQRTQSVIMKIGRCHDVYQNSTVPAKFETSNSDPTDEVTDFMCSWNNCRRFFENLETLASHVNKVHAVASSNDGLYYCRWEGCSRCERGFNARYKMLVHVRTHTKEKPHHCHLCEKCFSRAENLKIHIRSHSGEKPYICTYEGCRKAYSNSSDRFKHSRTHSMEKPYLCKFPGCQKRYTDPSSLRKHVKTFKHTEQLIHTGTLTVNSTNKDSTSKDSIYKINGSGRNSTQSNSYSAHYYVGVDSANICYMDVDELNYFYVADKSEPESYWIRKDPDDKTKYRSGYIVRHAGMDVEIEMPLDLRINRIV